MSDNNVIQFFNGQEIIAVSNIVPLPVTNFPGVGVPLGYVQIVGLIAATPLVPPPGAAYALIQPEGADCRWRDDGIAPTAGIGMLLYAGVNVQGVFPGNINTVKFIQTQPTTILNIVWY